jgi:Protein of unknown function (DUF1579)
MQKPHCCRLLLILGWIVISHLTPACAEDPTANYAKIREGMSKLAPLVGKWSAVALFHDGDKITENDGTWEINWALEDTYLEFRDAMHRKGDLNHHNGYITYVTYNPRTQQYDLTYFYTRSALRVTETGVYDEKTKQFRTQAFVPLEDGVRDENVRSIYDLIDPNKIVETHYSRYSNEPVERMQVQFTLTREQ